MKIERAIIISKAFAPPRLPALIYSNCASLLFIIAVIASTFPLARAAVVPQNRPNIADEVGEDKKNESRQPSRPARDTHTTPPRRRFDAAPNNRSTAGLINVTFATGVPRAELFLSGGALNPRKIGVTGADGKLFIKLARGIYSVAASHTGYRTQQQQIEVRSGSAAFFNVNLAPLVATAVGSAPVGTGGSSTSTAEAIIKRYLDPRQSDSVTISDWQTVQSQSGATLAQIPNDAMTKTQFLFAQGQLAYLRGDFPGAVTAFNAAALATPTSALAFHGLGNAYLATNQLPQALAAYQHALQLNDNLAMAYKGIGDVMSRQDKSRDALVYYERARVLGYSSPATNLNTARNLMRRERWSEALKMLLETSKTRPTADLFISIGDCYVGLQQLFSAAPAYRRAMQLDTKSALAHYKYGVVMYDSREYAAAAEALERALALDQTGASINRQRTRVLADKAAGKARRVG